MTRHVRITTEFLACAVVAWLGLGLVSSPAQALTGPQFDIVVSQGPSHLPPGGKGQFTVQVRNIGDLPATEESLTIRDHLPSGVTVENVRWSNGSLDLSGLCSGAGTETATCTVPVSVGAIVPFIAPSPGAMASEVSPEPSGYLPTMVVDVAISPASSGVGTNTATVTGGGAPPTLASDPVSISPVQPGFGVLPSSYSADFFEAPYPSVDTARQAGDHPFEQRLRFQLNTRSDIGTSGTRETLTEGVIRSMSLDLPEGLSGSPLATPRCSPAQFAQLGAVFNSTRCPAHSQVGYVNLLARERGRPAGIWEGPLSRIPIYNLMPPEGVLADFGFSVGGLTQSHVYLTVDPARNYAVKVSTSSFSSFLNFLGAEVTIWGVPGDPVHDRFRYFPEATEGKAVGAEFGPEAIRPLLTNPMSCGAAAAGSVIRVDSYERPELFTEGIEHGSPLLVQGCDDPRFSFQPSLSIDMDAEGATPSGLELSVRLPQRNDEVAEAGELYAANGSSKGIATPPMRRAVITLPEGMTVSPGVAQGLESCSESQIGLVSKSPPRFDANRPSCPDASKVGTVEIATPILADPLVGSLYVAEPRANPFDSVFALYVVAADHRHGIVLKLPARVELNRATGQVTVALDELPQQPLSEIRLHFKRGPRGALQMPEACGTQFASYRFTPWHSSDAVEGSSAFDVRRPCPGAGFSPHLLAGSVQAKAGSRSPFVVELNRQDGEEDISGFSLDLPRGLTAKLATVPLCPEVATSAADCPSAARIGSASVASGTGPAPLWLPQPGRPRADVFLAGPYRGEPFSMLVRLPAQTGPFDLGTVVIRAPIDVDARTVQARISVADLPQILAGVPIDYRTLRIVLDRPGFIRNPTGCAPARVMGTATSTTGRRIPISSPFQVAGCASLPFRPRASLRLLGTPARNGHPTLKAILRSGTGQAGVAAATLTLPEGMLLDLGRLHRLCPRNRAPERCPRRSRLGHARFASPFFDGPLRGPIYLRQPRHRLPDLVADLRDGSLRVLVRGHTAAPAGRLRIGLRNLPDVPLTRAVISLRGLLVNSEPLCDRPRRGEATFRAHNGKRQRLRQRLVLRGRC